MSNTAVLIVTEEQKRAVRKNINITEEQLKKDIDSILEWFRKQQHLPRIELDPRIIECLLISRKGSVEQTKQKIDLMYSLRNAIPEMAEPRDVMHPKIQNALKGCIFTTLPTLNHDYTRVSVLQYRDVEYFDLIGVANYLWTIFEFRLLHDYFAGETYIIDLQDITLGHLTKYTPTFIKNAEVYIRKAFGMRIFGIHIINGSNLFNKLIVILKAGLTEKIGSRIYVHSTYEDMYKVIDQDLLPPQYGGKGPTIADIEDNWQRELTKEETKKYLVAQEKLRSNEALRIGGQLDDELLGVAGSFKKLNVD